MQPPLILLAEDSEDDAFFFSRTVRQSGIPCEVHHVPNGSTAIQFLKLCAAEKRPVAVVFLDLKMPVLNGYEVLEWMQKQNFSPHIPVVVLSGSDQQSDRDRAIALGANGYLPKPIRLTEFRRFLTPTLAASGNND